MPPEPAQTAKWPWIVDQFPVACYSHTMGLGIRTRIARLLGVPVQTSELEAVDPGDIEIIRACKPYSMASAERILAVVNAVDHVIKAGIPGDFVECGVYRGGCSMAAALTFLRAGQSDRTLHLFDTFEGMSPAGLEDIEADTEKPAADLFPTDGKWCFADLDEVRRNMSRTDYPQSRIKMVKGKVEDTLPENAPDQIAVLRLDTDWYASTKHEMEHLYPRLVRGGVLIIDDYGHWAGSRQAVDEYLAQHGIHLLLNRTDYTGRMALKP